MAVPAGDVYGLEAGGRKPSPILAGLVESGGVAPIYTEDGAVGVAGSAPK